MCTILKVVRYLVDIIILLNIHKTGKGFWYENIIFASFQIRWKEEQSLLDLLLHKYSHTSTYEGRMPFTFLINLMEVVPGFESTCWDRQYPKNIATFFYLTFNLFKFNLFLLLTI